MKSTQSQEPTYKKIIVASFSAMAAETATFPIDITKTRLQLHNPTNSLNSINSPLSNTNAFKVAINIVKKDDFLGLYNGLSPALIRHLFYTPIRIVGYEQLRNSLVVFNGDGDVSLFSKAFVGGLSGVIAQVQVICQRFVELVRVKFYLINQTKDPLKIYMKIAIIGRAELSDAVLRSLVY